MDLSPGPYSGARIAVAGAGRSGAAAAELARRAGAAEVVVLEDGPPDRSAAAVGKLRAQGFRVLTGAEARECDVPLDLAVMSPGIDPSWPLATALSGRGIPLISEIEFAWRHSRTPVIAITGTNGKSTVTELIAHVLNGAGIRSIPCGNHGMPYSEIVTGGAPYDVLALEVSSFQLELIGSFRPAVAVWLNFAPDHLDRHPSLEAYRRAKLRIFENQTPSDTAVVNAEDESVKPAARCIRFSAWREDADWSYADGRILHGGRPFVRLSDTRLRGRHNAENIMAAAAAVGPWVAPDARLAELVSTYPPPPHRCEPAGVVAGREFLNDSKATNLHAMESALRGQERPVVLIAGGKQKGLDYSPLRELVREKTTHVFAIGEIGRNLADVWGGYSRCRVCGSLEEAVRAAAEAAVPGQTVLFSPGTSSFDMFTGYAHRGEVFRQLVSQLQLS